MKKKILIVEDDKDMQSIYKDLLGHKYNLTIVDNTKAAMTELEANNVGLMILDIILPGQTGDDFLVDLKQTSKLSKLHVVCVTVLGDITTQLRMIDENLTCIPKPFEKQELLNVVEQKISS